MDDRSLTPASLEWDRQVDRPAPGTPRHLGRELRVAMRAQRRIAADTTDMRSVFEVLENFPLGDVLRFQADRNPFINDGPFRAASERQQLPDLSTTGTRALLALPPGSLGHEYARWFEGWGLDNQFLASWDPSTPAQRFAYRYAHTHDLLHYVLSYAPYDLSREMEIEAFVHAQTGGLNHVVFILGLARALRHQDPLLLKKVPRRLREAHRRGARAENVMLVDWAELLPLPLDEVRRRLRVDDRPILPAERPIRPRPTETPALAHAVVNAPDVAEAKRFWCETIGLQESARDERLGAVFLTDGTDHHTLALASSWPRGLLGPVRGLAADAKLAVGMLRARRMAPRSSDGQPVTIPPLSIYRERLRPGLGHLGYRVSSEAELEAWYHHLKAKGVRVDWTVNHGDMIKGIYFKDPAGIRCEIFCDGPAAIEKHAAREAGVPLEELAAGDFYNWDLDLDRPGPADGVAR